MLGLGTSVTSIDSGQIYKELSELSNHTDLDIHFDMSTLTGDHGTEVTSVVNLGATGAGNNINSNEGAPTLDRTSLSRACVDFPNSGDNDNILDMATSYTTTGKAMTFFIVFQWDVVGTQVITVDADDSYSDYLTLGAGAGRLALAGGSASNVAFNDTDNSTVSYTFQANIPTVLLIQRSAGGELSFYTDNNIYVALVADPGDTNFTLGAIGGTTSSTLTDFNGKVCEVGLYNENIGSTAIQILLESLCTKWGINRRN